MKAKLLLVFVLLFCAKLKSQNPACTDIDELFRQRLTGIGNFYGHPYTMFDKTIDNSNSFNFDNKITKIRERINAEKASEGIIFKSYSIIFNIANGTINNDDGLPADGVSNLSQWAKFNAFVFLVGLDADGDFMDTKSYGGIAASYDKRNKFKQNVLDAFDGLHGEKIME